MLVRNMAIFGTEFCSLNPNLNNKNLTPLGWVRGHSQKSDPYKQRSIYSETFKGSIITIHHNNTSKSVTLT